MSFVPWAPLELRTLAGVRVPALEWPAQQCLPCLVWPGEPLPSGPRCAKAQGPGGVLCPSSLFPSVLPTAFYQLTLSSQSGPGRRVGVVLGSSLSDPALQLWGQCTVTHTLPPCSRAAWIDKCRPNLLITESTYATTIRDSKRCRERDFLKKVHETVERGGKVLIPVFALGRAQELCILLETFWERMNLKVPIYFSTGLTEKANHYYKLFIPWTNQKIRKTFVQRNMFEFKHIKAFDRAFADNPGPMVVFATPGMLHAGQSLQIFRKWAGNEKNMVIMPGYCVQGTVGHKILSGQRKLEMEGRQVLEVKMQVEYMSFSAHADAKGIMQLVGQAEPESVLLVHGEAKKMEFLKQKIEQELRVSCYMPANGETVTLPTSPSIPVGISLGLLKREMAQGLLPEAKKPRLLHGALIMKDSNFRLVSSEQALKELGLAEHQLRFTCRVHLHDMRKEQEMALRVYSHLKSVLKDHCVQHLPDGSVTVESILIQAAAPSEDPGTKVLLVSWTYQDEELGSFLTSLLKKGLPQAPS
ncbi:integrator complex subunit 11 isoform X3 [Trachypithecus francoisi]|uniref:integrator complex subunit 11 isoform X3 n=1 Tax=Trachypithecus francoisi TaxID=54180 RepID=UPI00141B8AFF|nr:integrator complex subunit 11 isoform X3 [Trachypithecus francoisi]